MENELIKAAEAVGNAFANLAKIASAPTNEDDRQAQPASAYKNKFASDDLETAYDLIVQSVSNIRETMKSRDSLTDEEIRVFNNQIVKCALSIKKLDVASIDEKIKRDARYNFNIFAIEKDYARTLDEMLYSLEKDMRQYDKWSDGLCFDLEFKLNDLGKFEKHEAELAFFVNTLVGQAFSKIGDSL
jgi:hypothetical protein